MSDESTHGQPRTYRRGCRCDLCRAAWTAYCRDHRGKRAYVPRTSRPTDGQPCATPNCENRRHQGYRLCRKCRWRMKQHGALDDRMKFHAPIAERYARFVIRGPECWDWTGTKNNHGYGRLGSIYAHRVSYERTFGPIPKGMHVLHRCDNPPCTNPSHLMIGTHADNMADMRLKGRVSGGASGIRIGRVTKEHIEEMRRMKSSGMSSKEIGDHFGVSANYATQLISGRKSVRA